MQSGTSAALMTATSAALLSNKNPCSMMQHSVLIRSLVNCPATRSSKTCGSRHPSSLHVHTSSPNAAQTRLQDPTYLTPHC